MLHQQGQDSRSAEIDPLDIDVETVVEICLGDFQRRLSPPLISPRISFKLFSHPALANLIPICRPCIIHQAIHAAKSILRCLNQPQPISSARDVCLVEAHGFRGRGDGGATAFLVDVGNDDAGALGSKVFGDGGAVAGAAAFMIGLVVEDWGEGEVACL